jgi:uncharacterized protein (DUF427 family)
MSAITIRMKNDDSLLLQASDNKLQKIEGNYYIHPELIDLNQFEISDRIYNCPVKGICLWVDLKTELGWINDICWVYPEPKQAYQHIKGWFGFYPSHRQYEIIRGTQ